MKNRNNQQQFKWYRGTDQQAGRQSAGNTDAEQKTEKIKRKWGQFETSSTISSILKFSL